MSYRPRESLAFRGTQSTGRGANLPSSQTGPGTGRKPKPQEPEENQDILLRDDEIVECLRSIGFTGFTSSDLMKPTPGIVQMVYEHLVDDLMGIRREVVDPMLAAAMEEIEFPETHRDSMTLMAFYRALSRLMAVCNVPAFSLADVLRPEYPRLKIILSNVINFMRFRTDEERAPLIAEQMLRPDAAKARVEDLIDRNEGLLARIEDLRAREQREAPLIGKAREINERLTADLFKFQQKQKVLVETFERERTERKTLAAALKDRAYLTERTREECDKIRPYIVDSPDKLQQVISDMTSTLASEKALCEHMDRRTRALQTSADAFAVIHADVSSCIKVMEECESELVREEDAQRKASRNEEILKNRENEVRDAERSESLLQRQLKNFKERIDRSRQQAEQKREGAQKKMEQLTGVYEELRRERDEKSRDMERKKMMIEQIEKKMEDLKEVMEIEMQTSHVEMAKMKAHIEKYIRDMEQRINSVS